MTAPTRNRTVLLVVHPGRGAANETARRVGKALGENGIRLRLLSREAVDRGSLHLDPAELHTTGAEIEVVDGEGDEHAAEGCELVLVLGGDGTFLRAAELARNAEIPVLGINLGRIGFLAEAEAEAIDEILEHVVAHDYRVEHRMALDVVVSVGEEVLYRALLFGQLFRHARWGFVFAGLASAVFFGAGHLYQGSSWGSLAGIFLVTFMGGMWFSWLYVEYGYNLWVPMSYHFFMNLSWAVFEAGGNALGGVGPNIFRIATIALSIWLTIRHKRRTGEAWVAAGRRWWRGSAVQVAFEH